MITKEAIEAAARAMCEAWHYSKIGTPDGDAEWRRKQDQYRMQARAALTAAFAAMPGPAVKVKPLGKEFEEAIFSDVETLYEATAITPAPDLASENERLRAALEKVVDWASRRCPADDESVPCPLCGARADIPGDFCKSVESIFPRDLLRDTRAALERT